MYLSFGLHHQTAHTLRAFAWFGLWFAIADSPLSQAEKAARWPMAVQRLVWSGKFIKWHATIWRLLLTFALFKSCSLLSGAASKILSLKFHETNHFAAMQSAMVHEHVLQALSQSHGQASRTQHVRVNGKVFVLKGMACAHWSGAPCVMYLHPVAAGLLAASLSPHQCACA